MILEIHSIVHNYYELELYSRAVLLDDFLLVDGSYSDFFHKFNVLSVLEFMLETSERSIDVACRHTYDTMKRI